MRKIKHLAIVVAALSIMACSSDKDRSTSEGVAESQTEASTPVTSGKYKIKSGTIHFETSGMGLKGKKIVYFDDYGAKERVETYSGDDPLEGYNTSDGKKRYYVDLENKSAWIVDEYGSRGWEMEFQSWETIERQGDDKFKRVDNITVAGKDCEAYEYNGLAVFAGWQGLTLYHKQKPDLLVEAVKLEENVEHDASLFGVPEGFELKERPAF